jgi:hypothetical protein
MVLFALAFNVPPPWPRVLAVHGAMILAVGAFMVFCMRHRHNWLLVLKILGVSAFLGMLVGTAIVAAETTNYAPPEHSWTVTLERTDYALRWRAYRVTWMMIAGMALSLLTLEAFGDFLFRKKKR